MRPIFDVASDVVGLSFFDFVPFPDDGFVQSEVDVGGRYVVQAIVPASVVLGITC
jgi:hypothetical protein